MPLLLSALLALFLLSPVTAEDKADLQTVYRIKNEAFQNSKVMDHLFYLTDVHGPRLTGSPGIRAAADWSVKQLAEYGIDGKLEKWGPFGRSWNFTKFSAHMLEPRYSALIGFPLAWSQGTNGVLTGEPILAVLKVDADLEKHKGKLSGRIVMVDPLKELPLQTTAAARRYNDSELNDTFLAPDPSQRSPAGRTRTEEARRFRSKLHQFLRDEGVLAVVGYGTRGDGGTVFGTYGGSREVKDPIPPPMIAITPEHYNRVIRLLEKKIPVKLAIEVDAALENQNADSFNVIAEIPGVRKKDEVVMLGAHLDSWHAATGATDNGAGCAVAMEAMRILKSLNLKMDRTVRLALWSGEEQGLLGSKAYVKERFADIETMATTTEHAKLSAYFNLDNGTGKIRGVYLQGNDMLRPTFEAWLAPFRDLGATTVSIRNTGGTDHLSFDAVGLPGFQFIQDSVEYSTRTHHSNMDTYDRIVKGDLMQAAAIMASMVYHTANHPELLPRKTLPKPQPKKDAATPTRTTEE